MKRALIIRHAAPETLGSNYSEVLHQAGFDLVPVDLFDLAPDYASFPAPSLAEVSLVVALGGPLSANDDYPSLKAEIAYLRDATVQGIPVFGVCLGAQLLSRALGGRVEPTGGYQFGLRRLCITAAGDADPVFGKLRVPLVPTLHGECFSVPPGGAALAEGYILLRDGGYRRIDMAFRQGSSYGFQFEPQLTLDELQVWNRELADDYLLMGDRFDPQEEAARNLREFARFAPVHEEQMRDMLWAFLETTGLLEGANTSASHGRRP